MSFGRQSIRRRHRHRRLHRAHNRQRPRPRHRCPVAALSWTVWQLLPRAVQANRQQHRRQVQSAGRWMAAATGAWMAPAHPEQPIPSIRPSHLCITMTSTTNRRCRVNWCAASRRQAPLAYCTTAYPIGRTRMCRSWRVVAAALPSRPTGFFWRFSRSTTAKSTNTSEYKPREGWSPPWNAQLAGNQIW